MITKKHRRKSYVVIIYTTHPKPLHKYMHLDVKRFYKEGGDLVIEEYKGVRKYRYSIETIKKLMFREAIEGVYWDVKKNRR